MKVRRVYNNINSNNNSNKNSNIVMKIFTENKIIIIIGCHYFTILD